MRKAGKDFFITKKLTVKEAMLRMSQIAEKQLFVIDEKKKLFGALSDGDIRKWILKGGHLREKVEHVCNHQPRFVKKNYDIDLVRKLMLKLKITAIPVLAEDSSVDEVLTWERVFAGEVKRHINKINVPVVIMAGGKGTRLDPFTRILPKPLIPIGEKPILQIIMDKFVEQGGRKFFLSINHKARMVKSYFEEYGAGYRICYIEENRPLGTVGSLRLLKGRIKGVFLVTNCDTIINIDYNEIVKFHKDNGYDMTLVVSCKRYVIPYGVCEVHSGGLLKSINEKPEHDYLVNTGMYVMSSRIFDFIPVGKVMHINELIAKIKNKGMSVGLFPIDEKAWIDIGQWDEYHRAVRQLGG
ncbi:MAG: nucleotidyltransferase family protein [Candidatus Omnitrophica bacterium]|nr:nucleotidyltransferase family protein [Candidatus Omnitrophota bacterium]